MRTAQHRDTNGGMVNGFDETGIDLLDDRSAGIIRRRANALGPAYKLFYRRPVEIVRGLGVRLYDADGAEYLDAYNNVASIGHSNPDVVRAIVDQVGTLNTNTRYLNEGLVEYAERLLATHDVVIDQTMFTCTGSEAVDLALRIARHVTGRTGIIVSANAYHGITSAVAEISPSLGKHVPLGPFVRVVPAPIDDGRDVGAVLAADVTSAIEDLRRHGIEPAAMIVDTVFSSDGLRPGPAGFLRSARDVVADAGAVFIADEVQPGFARTGDAFWGYQRHGISPDIAVMGKPMGNGMPIAGIAARSELLADFGKKTRYFNTFGGNTVSVAAASAVLEYIQTHELLANSRVQGHRLLEGMKRILGSRASIGDVRGAGLYTAADVVDPITGRADGAAALAIVNGLRDRRVLISATGPEGSILKVRPPLVASAADIDELLDRLDATVTAVELP